MARRSAAFERLTPVQRDELDAALAGGELSWRALARKYAIAEATLREHAARNGIIRNPTGLKRALVEQALAKPDPAPPAGAGATATGSTAGTPRTDLEAAAAEDVKDMRLAIQCARIALSLVAQKLQRGIAVSKDQPALVDYDARELKILSECISINTDTIRRIRGLDAIAGIPDVSQLSNEQLEKLAKGRPLH